MDSLSNGQKRIIQNVTNRIHRSLLKMQLAKKLVSCKKVARCIEWNGC